MVYSRAQMIAWNVCKTTKGIGSKATLSDPYVYLYGSSPSYVVLSAYMDDVLLIRYSPAVVKGVQVKVMSKFSMTDLEQARLVLGMEIQQREGIILIW